MKKITVWASVGTVVVVADDATEDDISEAAISRLIDNLQVDRVSDIDEICDDAVTVYDFEEIKDKPMDRVGISNATEWWWEWSEEQELFIASQMKDEY